MVVGNRPPMCRFPAAVVVGFVHRCRKRDVTIPTTWHDPDNYRTRSSPPQANSRLGPSLRSTDLLTESRTPTYTYVHRQEESCELYDRVADPDETRNIIGGSKLTDTARELQGTLTRWLIETSDVIEWERDPRFPTVQTDTASGASSCVGFVPLFEFHQSVSLVDDRLAASPRQLVNNYCSETLSV